MTMEVHQEYDKAYEFFFRVLARLKSMFVTNIIRLERKLNINKLYEKVLYRLEEILSNLL